MGSDIFDKDRNDEDNLLDNIRPETLDEYIGQKDVTDNLKVFIEEKNNLIMFFYMGLLD